MEQGDAQKLLLEHLREADRRLAMVEHELAGHARRVGADLDDPALSAELEGVIKEEGAIRDRLAQLVGAIERRSELTRTP